MGIENVLNNTLKLYRQHIFTLIKPAVFLILIPYAIFLVILLLMGISLVGLTVNLDTPEFSSFTLLLIISFVLLFGMLFIMTVLSSLLQIATMKLVHDKKTKLTFSFFMQLSRKYLIKYVVLDIIIITITIFFSLFFFVPGLIVFIYMMLANYPLVLEDKGIIASLKESHRLIVRNWWRSFCYFCILMIISFVIGGILAAIEYTISLPFSIIPTAALIISLVIRGLASIFMFPIGILFLQQYYDLLKKERKR